MELIDMMKTKERCIQFVDNIQDTAERLKVGSTFKNLPADMVDKQLATILRMCEYLTDSLDQED